MTLYVDEKTENLLPYDGTVQYFGKVLTENEAAFYLDRLLHTIE